MRIYCRRCGAENLASAETCVVCTSELGAISQSGDSNESLALADIDGAVSEQNEPSNELRKLVTVMFCHIGDSPAVAEAIDGESLRKLTDRLFNHALVEVYAASGILHRFFDDGFMAIFGESEPAEDHVRNAISAATAIQRRCHAPQVNQLHTRFPLRIGLNTGPIIPLSSSDVAGSGYVSVEDTVELAATMQRIAAPGEILISEHTNTTGAHFIRSTHLGRHRVKQHPERVTVFRLDENARHAHSAVNGSGIRSMMYGREHEISAIGTYLTKLRHGDGGIISLSGAAGIGKSRLLLEVRHTIAGDVQWIQGHATSLGRHVSYSPFANALRALVGIQPDMSQQTCWLYLGRFLKRSVGESADSLLPFVGMILGLEPQANKNRFLAHLDPHDVRSQIYIAARRLIEAVTRTQATVLQLDDWQWADEASAALLEHLLPLVETSPLLICVSSRSSTEGSFGRLNRVTRSRFPGCHTELSLQPLNKTESTQLVTDLSRQQALSPAIQADVLERAAGNPLFIEEAIRAYRNGGAEAKESSTIGLPLAPSVEAVITARIDNLEADLKRLLRNASVIGRTFYAGVLHEIHSAKTQLERHLEQLQHFDLIHPIGVASEQRFEFKHAIVHEASYQSLIDSRRSELHGEVVGAIEKIYPDRLNERVGILAYHHARAGNQTEAQRYHVRAGDQASIMSSDVEALAHYERAMQGLRRSGRKRARNERASLERRIGETAFRLGQHKKARAHLYRSLALIGDRYPRTRFAVRMSIFTHLLLQLWNRLWFRPSQLHSRPLSSDEEVRKRNHVTLSWIDYYVDSDRFLLSILKGLNWTQRNGMADGLVHGLCGLGVICNGLSFHKLAESYHRSALDTAKALSDPAQSAIAEFGTAIHHHYIGNWSIAIDYAASANKHFRTHGKIREQGISAALLSGLQQKHGEFQHAEDTVAALVTLASEAGDQTLRLYARERECSVMMFQGQLDAAADGMQDTVAGLREVHDVQIFCLTSGVLSGCLIWRGEFDLARKLVNEGCRVLHEEQVFPDYACELEFWDGWLALREVESLSGWRRGNSIKRARQAIRRLQRLGRAFTAANALALRLSAVLAWHRGRLGQAQIAWAKCIELNSQIGGRYQRAATLQEMGRLTGIAKHLDQALEEFERFGCRLEVARTLRILGETKSNTDPKLAMVYIRRCLTLHATLDATHEQELVENCYRSLTASLPQDPSALLRA